MNSEIRQSKIYSYFHGPGNVFQQFIIAVGILCILLSPVAGRAQDIKASNTHEKYVELNTTAQELKKSYEKLFDEYSTSDSYNFNCELFEEVKIAENDKNLTEKTAYNNALKAYKDAEEKANASKKSTALKKTAEELKVKYQNLYDNYQYRYWFDAELFGEISIDSYDWYESEKTAYNNALRAYKEADKNAKAAEAEEKKDSKYAEADANVAKLKAECEKLYNEYHGNPKYNFICTEYEEIEVLKDDKFSEEKSAHNKALKEYTKAAEKAEKKLNKYESLRSSPSALSVLFPIVGVIAVIAGIIWSIIKKFTFNKKSCEEAYDEELQIKVEEAKEKALEKLNIVAEQIDKVEPVVLNGIATYSSTTKNAANRLGAVVQGLVDLFVATKVIIIGAIAAAIYCGISMIFGSAFFIPAIGAVALSVFLGIKFYNKYEKEFYVNTKLIKKLEKMQPSLFVKLGTDSNIRVSLPAITVYMFGDEQIYMYYQYLDIVTGKIFCEGIHEYFYEDIVGVVSAQETKKIFKRAGFLKLFIKPVDYLKESITVVSSGCQHSESYIVPVGNSLLDTSFVGMRNLIRQKKAEK
jgi:hypothetical protein